MSHQDERERERQRELKLELERKQLREQKRHDHVEEHQEFEGVALESIELRILSHIASSFSRIATSLEDLVILNTPPPQPVLTSVKLQFELGGTMSFGTVTIPNLGQKTKATLKGFDQNGQPMADSFVMPAVTFTLDNPALNSILGDGANGADITSLASGTANLTAQVTSAEGLALSDTQSIINQGGGAPPPNQTLTSVKLDFTPPA